MHSLTPHLVCAGAADVIKFYVKAFDAIELVRLPGPQGKLMHACIRIGDSALMLVDESPEWGMLGPKALKGSSVTYTSKMSMPSWRKLLLPEQKSLCR